LEEFEHYRNSLKVASFPAIALERATLSRARAVLAVSARSRLDLVGKYGIGPEEVEVIGNGVDFEKFSGRRESVNPAALKRVLVVSRLEPRKNVKEAIEAVAELPRGSCLLDIVGDGSERGALTALVKSAAAEDVVHFLGRVREESLPELYAGSAIFLTTSRSEGFGLSLLEAMASSCACVVSDLPTHKALIEHGVSGLIYRTRQELVAYLRDLLASPVKVRDLGTSAQRVARAHTWEKVAERVSRAYARVARGSKA
jgi:glycosyltransferase involved in cell wall biosynthesis